MYIKSTINLYKQELKKGSIRRFLLIFISYAMVSSLLLLSKDFISNPFFFQSESIYWKLVNIGSLFLFGLIVFFHRIHLKHSGIFLSILQIYLYISFATWKSDELFDKDSQLLLVLPLAADIHWKFNAASAFAINIFEIVMLFTSHEITPFCLFALINFIKSCVFVSIAAHIKQRCSKNLLAQHKKDRYSLLNLQNLLKNVLPLAILVIQDKKVVFQNLETRRLLRYPKFVKIEEILNKIIITEIKFGSMFLNSFDDDESLEKDRTELRLFDFLQKKYFNIESNNEFDALYGEIEEFDRDSIYENLSRRARFVEIKVTKIFWEGKESLIVIMTDDSRGETMIAEQCRYKDKLLATISHDLRTPLNGVIGLLEMGIDSITEKKIKKCLTVALRSSKLLLFMINNILDFTLLSNGKLKLNHTVFDVVHSVREVAKLIKFQAKSKGVNFELDNKISEPGQAFIRSDPTRFKQVVLNLLGNALKYTQKGFIKITIELEGTPMNVKISVEDTGIGIKREEIPRLFKPFGKPESEENKNVSDNGVSMGMGLALSRILVKRLNKDSREPIQVLSEYGKGSLFHFVLRDIEIESGSECYFNTGEINEDCVVGRTKQINIRNLPENDSLREDSSGTFNSIKQSQESPLIHDGKEESFNNILVVDDDQINIIVFSTYLKSFPDCKFDLAFNGQEAITLIKDKAQNNIFYDMIFMDCNMPVMDGFQATRKIIEMENQNIIPPVPIIASTANASLTDCEQCFENGMVDFLPKPFGKALLRGKIDKHSKVKE